MNKKQTIKIIVGQAKVYRVKEFSNKYSNTSSNYQLEDKQLKNILKKLPNGKATGYNTTSYEMFKHGYDIELEVILITVLETMFKHSIIPKYFNISIICPLVKDKNEPNYITNNLRPISVSDPITNIFERVLLEESNKEFNSDPKQFGLKKNSSFQHAINYYNESKAMVFVNGVYSQIFKTTRGVKQGGAYSPAL